MIRYLLSSSWILIFSELLKPASLRIFEKALIITALADVRSSKDTLHPTSNVSTDKSLETTITVSIIPLLESTIPLIRESKS
ncbi:MAG: hypothetical protein QXK95_02080 [Nitrososphaerota archaeon]